MEIQIPKIIESCGNKLGFRKNGFCSKESKDPGKHTVCATMTSDFLDYTRSKGNNLSNLRIGDRWCICESRYEEARAAGKDPKIHPEASSYNFPNH